MKKSLLALAGLALIFAGCAKTEDINNLQSQIDELKSDKIASIESQISSINTSIKSLEDMDKELKGYIETLQTTAGNLQKAIDANDKKIDDVKAELNTNISTAKSELLGSLESLRSDMKGELATINTTILSLQQKDVEIDGKIVDLKSYVNDELKKTQDWATGTFATLKQFNDLSGEVSAIKADIVLVKESITSLETRLTGKINKDISDATALLDAQIKQSVKDVTDAYTKAVSDAKTEITEAYEKAIANAVNALETSMKSWVNEQLAGYYTISETEVRLTAVQTNLESQLASQKTYLEGLITGLQTTLTSKIDANKTLIDGLQSQVNQLSADLSTLTGKVTTNSTNISNNAKAISDNAKAISQNAADIDACEKLIAANKKLIDENTAAINANDKDIAALQSRATADEKKIADNTAAIAKNATDIAKNAELIAANATAISNNAKAISDNAAEIVQLKADLVQAKKDITDAYTNAIGTAINELDGKLSGQIATEVATLNKRIDDEVATINAAIDALASRVTTCENDIKEIKDTIEKILEDIDGLKEQLADILARIQSINVVPTYSDGSVKIYNKGLTDIYFEILPREASVALAKKSLDYFAVSAVTTETKASIFTDIPVKSISDNGECFVVTVDGTNLSQSFFKGEIGLSARLKIDDGNNSLGSPFFVMSPNVERVSVTGISIVKELTITVLGTYTLTATITPEDATEKGVVWSSSKEGVATVSSAGKITPVSVGTTVVTAKTKDGGLTASCNVKVEEMPEYVDLGLPSGLKWATCNLGANSPEEYGDYYAWGETETKSYYSEDTYKFYKSETVSEGGFDIEYRGYTKYIPQSKASQYGFRGFYDNKSVLNADDDAAHVKLGGSWRMPTLAEFTELINNCQCDWVTYKGVKGRKFTSKKTGYTDKWIFLPASGLRYGGGLGDAGSDGYYWSSSLEAGYPDYACGMYFDSDYVERYYRDRYYGLSVRPVLE